jgi:hypothetical protein
MTTTLRTSTLTGVFGTVCLGVFFLALPIPERADEFLRPYGLYAWLSILVAAVVLTTIAAILGSKRWFVVTALGIITLVWFSLRVLK